MLASSVRAASVRAAGMPRSAIREIMNLAATLPDVIHLEVGEPDATTPDFIIAAAFDAVRQGATKYAPNAGLMPLREAIAARVFTRWSKRIPPERVVVTTGAIGALFTAMFSVLDPGDEVLIPDPGWPNYESIGHLAGARPVRYHLRADNAFLPDVGELGRLTTDRTKAILLNSPGNPTGGVFPQTLLQDIVTFAREAGLYLISDEIYEDIIFEGEHVSVGAFEADEQVLVISGFSKSYAMTGWRLGWLVCPPALAATATSLQEPVTSCAPTPSQKAGEAALRGDQTCVDEFREMFRRRRDLVVKELDGSRLLTTIPCGAFYALIDISGTGLGSFDCAKAILLETATAVVPGITFGPACDRYVRIAYTTSDDRLVEGVRRIRRFIEGRSGR
jgi:aspartate/methionine/tyrosine aminotransferase